MQVNAKLKNLRVSARKVRLVADMIRGKDVNTAKVQLQFSTKKTSTDLLGLLNSAIANAENNFNLKEEDLFVETIFVNDEPVLKRWRPRAMGRASAIRKRSCTVNLVLNEKDEAASAAKPSAQTNKPAEVKVAKKESKGDASDSKGKAKIGAKEKTPPFTAKTKTKRNESKTKK